jgi:hypothetical protein
MITAPEKIGILKSKVTSTPEKTNDQWPNARSTPGKIPVQIPDQRSRSTPIKDYACSLSLHVRL